MRGSTWLVTASLVVGMLVHCLRQSRRDAVAHPGRIAAAGDASRDADAGPDNGGQADDWFRGAVDLQPVLEADPGLRGRGRWDARDQPRH